MHSGIAGKYGNHSNEESISCGHLRRRKSSNLILITKKQKIYPYGLAGAGILRRELSHQEAARVNISLLC